MKKLLLLALLALLAVSGSALAQVAGPAGLPPQSPAKARQGDRIPPKEMAKINESILDKLGLTDDQKAKIKAHDDEMDAKRKELRKSAKGGDKEAAKEKQKALRKENQTFMKSILTKDQLKQLAKLRKEAIAQYHKDHAAKP